MPDHLQSPALSDRSGDAGDNIAPDRDESGDKPEILWKGHPSYLGYLHFYIAAVAFIVLGSLHWFFMLWGVALGVSLAAVSLFDRNSKLYTITETEILAKANIHRYRDEVRIEDITGVNLCRGPVERLFGLGTVKVVFTALAEDDDGEVVEEEVEIVFRGIRRYRQIAAKIEELR